MSAQRVALLLLVLLPCTAVCQEIPWQAERVMLRRDGVRAGKPVAGHLVRQGMELSADSVYTVLRADGGLLEMGDNCGWVTRADVVRMSEASAFYTARIKEEPTAAKWYGRRAMAKTMGEYRLTLVPGGPGMIEGRPADALGDLEAAVRLSPADTGWRKILLGVYSTLGRNDKAIEQCEAVLALAPNDAGGYASRATVRFLSGDLKGAVADSEQAVKLDATAVDLQVALALLYLQVREQSKGIEAARKAVGMSATNADAYHRRAMACFLLGDKEGLLAATNESLRLDPSQHELRLKRAVLLRQKGEYISALHDIRRAMRAMPGDATPVRMEAFLLATCRDDCLRDGKRAVELSARAIELLGRSPDYLYLETKAAAYAEVGDFSTAVSAQKQAIRAIEGKPNYYEEITGIRWWLMQYEREQPRRE